MDFAAVGRRGDRERYSVESMGLGFQFYVCESGNDENYSLPSGRGMPRSSARSVSKSW